MTTILANVESRVKLKLALANGASRCCGLITFSTPRPMTRTLSRKDAFNGDTEVESYGNTSSFLAGVAVVRGLSVLCEIVPDRAFRGDHPIQREMMM